MTEPLGWLRRFLAELKRRKVYRVGVAYLVVAFVVLQLAELAAGAFGLPEWFEPMVWVLCGLGFPLALVLAWAFEMTPEGVRRTASGEPEGAEGGEARKAGLPLAAKGLVALGLLSTAAAGGWYLIGAESEPESSVGDRSVAVLPFEALGQEEAGPLTEGMHDALLTRLSNISGLKVISRTAVQQFRGSDMTTGEVADSLGVRWVVEGGVQEMGDQIQVNAQLIDPRSETHAWADSYRRDLTAEDLFALQSDITKRIARSLEAQLTPGEAERVERRPTDNLEAYRLYVRGRRQLNTQTAEGIRAAVDFFQQALRQDSTYALAWAGISEAAGFSILPHFGFDSLPASLPDQEHAARRALELDPDLAEAHASMAFARARNRNFPGALRELHRAVELKPSYAGSYFWLGITKFYMGRLEEAREDLSLVLDLAPEHVEAHVWMVWTLVAEGQARQAETHLPQVPEARRPPLQAQVLYGTNRWDELERLARMQLSEAERSPAVWHRHLAMIAARQGDTTSVREHLKDLRQLNDLFEQGLVHAALGERDEAFAAWRDAEGSPPDGPDNFSALRYRYPNLLGPLRDDPRYRQLIQEINEYWGLNPDGSLPDSVDVSFTSRSDE